MTLPHFTSTNYLGESTDVRMKRVGDNQYKVTLADPVNGAQEAFTCTLSVVGSIANVSRGMLLAEGEADPYA
jgi:hypothetical protein